jgi:secretion/DNA translocation related CpaE-like protein
MSAVPSGVIAVVGGSGGVGASSFAAALASAAGRTLLIDLDAGGGGIDVLLDVDGVSGARWSGLHLAGGCLEPTALWQGLPRWGACALLAADAPELDPAAVEQVLDVAAQGGQPVVVDLPRHHCAERSAALARCTTVVVVARADVAGLVAARATVDALGDVPAGVVVRRGAISAEDAARAVGAPLLGVLPGLAAPLLSFGRPTRAARQLARALLPAVTS